MDDAAVSDDRARLLRSVECPRRDSEGGVISLPCSFSFLLADSDDRTSLRCCCRCRLCHIQTRRSRRLQLQLFSSDFYQFWKVQCIKSVPLEIALWRLLHTVVPQCHSVDCTLYWTWNCFGPQLLCPCQLPQRQRQPLRPSRLSRWRRRPYTANGKQTLYSTFVCRSTRPVVCGKPVTPTSDEQTRRMNLLSSLRTSISTRLDCCRPLTRCLARSLARFLATIILSLLCIAGSSPPHPDVRWQSRFVSTRRFLISVTFNFLYFRPFFPASLKTKQIGYHFSANCNERIIRSKNRQWNADVYLFFSFLFCGHLYIWWAKEEYEEEGKEQQLVLESPNGRW